MEIAVIGTGYVGLVAGACFADTGNNVVCVDKDTAKIESLKKGVLPIFEPGLETLVERGVSEGRLKFTTSTKDAVQGAEIIFLAVGTPALPSGEPDMTFVRAAAQEIAQAMNGYKLIVNKSTVPIGSHRAVADWMSEYTQHKFDVASNPEFLKEGTAVDDFLKPDRVVIGTEKHEVFQKLNDLYMPFVRQGNPIIHMDPISAEVTKYACNSFLATRISFMNELAALCDKVGGDVERVRRGMTTDERIGRHFLYPGVGYGGSCFPKDVQALLSTAKRSEVRMGIIEATEEANQRQKQLLAAKVKSHFGGNIKGKAFAIWGLAFKPNTDDIREAPALTIIDELLEAGAQVRAFDPVASENAQKIYGSRVTFTDNAFDATNGADALLVVTEWNEFKHASIEKIKKSLKTPVLFDGRNIYKPSTLIDAGFAYYGIGRGSSHRI